MSALAAVRYFPCSLGAAYPVYPFLHQPQLISVDFPRADTVSVNVGGRGKTKKRRRMVLPIEETSKVRMLGLHPRRSLMSFGSANCGRRARRDPEPREFL